jgi:hypothetical protein
MNGFIGLTGQNYVPDVTRHLVLVPGESLAALMYPSLPCHIAPSVARTSS